MYGVTIARRKRRSAPSSGTPPGCFCGRVTDYAVNEATLAIEAVEMIPGYLGSARKKRIWVYDYQRSENHAEELIVPACLGGELTLTKEGNEQCAYPP